MKKIILTGIALILIVLTVVMAASAANFPYTRYSHPDEWCMYYTGEAMCWIEHEYCDPRYGVEVEYAPGELGDCPQNVAAELSLKSKDITVTETEVVKIKAECTDSDGDKTSLKFSGWMKSSSKNTDYDDAGSYKVDVECLDENGFGESETVRVTVLNKNRPPVFIGSWS